MFFSRKNKQYATEILVCLNSIFNFDLILIDTKYPDASYEIFLFTSLTLNDSVLAQNEICNVFYIYKLP